MLTETQAWQKIYDAFERYENGEFNRMAANGICNALSKLLGDEEISNETHAKMLRSMRGFLLLRGFDPYSICWPITQEGAASRCEFIREHFPAGTSEATEATVSLNSSNPTQS